MIYQSMCLDINRILSSVHFQKSKGKACQPFAHRKTHYCLITDLNKMLHSQTNYQHKTFYCTYCLHRFIRKDLLDQHKPLCEKHGEQCTELPSGKYKIRTFKNWGKMLKVPFVIYADFECILSPLQNRKNKSHFHESCGYS